MSDPRPFSREPDDKRAFTRSFDLIYSRTARVYDVAVRALPVWQRWLGCALPYIDGPRVLEVSFGTGWLLTHYACRVHAHGVDLNPEMVAIAHRHIERAGLSAALCQGAVEALPYRDDSFDTVVNTMAFSGYPDGVAAMSELRRVLRPSGRLVLIDVAYPGDGNARGTALVRLWRRAGDLIRDMPGLFGGFGFDVEDEEIGGWGSIHLYVARKAA